MTKLKANLAEYFLTAVVVCALAYLFIVPTVNSIADSMDNSANMIAEAGK